MELFKQTNFDFLGKKWPFIIASLVLTAAGLGSLAVKGGPRYGIDFKGGANMDVVFVDRPQVDKIRTAIARRLPAGSVPDVQEVTGKNEVLIGVEQQGERELSANRQVMTEALAEAFGQSNGKLDINSSGVEALANRLRDPLSRGGAGLNDKQLTDLATAIHDFRNSPPRSGVVRSVDDLASVPGVTPTVLNVLRQETYAAPYTIRSVEVVGPKVGKELQQKAILATLYALGGMLLYIAFRFEWIYGVAAVIAVFHDTVITIGLFSLFDKEISLTVVAALLTLVGYSMNDTIVVFDRIRENLKAMRRERLDTIVNLSVNQTLSRTILTSGLTFLTALALLLFGGPVLNGFAFALVVGILVGTYSSVFVASPILVAWHNYLEQRKKAPAVAVTSPRGTR